MTNPFPRDRLLTIEEYFHLEEQSTVRHEYLDGEIRAMSGVTRQHSRITMNVGARLWAAARGGPCRVHQSDVMLQIGQVVYYPDVMAACGSEPSDPRVALEPSLIVEVLSPTTERTDRGEKAMAYRGLPSLTTYVIVEQDRRWVERQWRTPNGPWQREIFTDAGTVAIASPSLTLTLDEIYEGVTMPSPAERLRLREEALAYG
jgi:Uma2 family endonuclease